MQEDNVTVEPPDSEPVKDATIKIYTDTEDAEAAADRIEQAEETPTP